MKQQEVSGGRMKTCLVETLNVYLNGYRLGMQAFYKTIVGISGGRRFKQGRDYEKPLGQQ
jgi:hypothetical protein